MAVPNWLKVVGKMAYDLATLYVTSRPTQPPVPVQPSPPPEPVPVQPVPIPGPPLTLEQRYSDQLDRIYMEEWGRVIGKVTTGDATERWQGYQLLAAGREDELRKNLRERK